MKLEDGEQFRNVGFCVELEDGEQFRYVGFCVELEDGKQFRYVGFCMELEDGEEFRYVGFCVELENGEQFRYVDFYLKLEDGANLEVFTSVLLKTEVVRHIKQCRPKNSYRRSEGLQSVYCVILKMKAIRFFETSGAIYQTTRRPISEDFPSSATRL